jgi:polyferredoxin
VIAVVLRGLLIVVLSLASVHAESQPPAPTASEAAAPDTRTAPPDGQPADDPWDFPDDEEEAATWSDLLRQQAVDIGMFVAFAAFAMVSFFRKSVPLKYVALVAAVLYLGVAKSQLISIVNVFGLITGNLPVLEHSLAWYTFAIFSVASTVLWGRLYCGRVCAFGALTQLMDKVVPAKLRVDVPARLEKRAAYVKYGLLGFTVLYFLITRDIGIYRYVEPFWMFTGQGSVLMWTLLAVLLAATVFVKNLYCRFLCPVGAALGLLSSLTVFKIKRWKECNTCKICEKTCEWGAIRGPKIVKSECVRCDDCERLYLDQKKCPHWIIIRKKSEIMASQSAAPAR